MNRAIVTAGLWALAFSAGITLGHFICRSMVCRDRLGVAFGRGHILAMSHARGIYEQDVESELARIAYINGDEAADRPDANVERAVLSKLIAGTTAQELAKNVEANSARVDHAMDLVRDQFRDSKTYSNALASNHLTVPTLRSEITAGSRAENWLERVLQTEGEIAGDDPRRYFDAHSECFVAPERWRASHLFMAAPSETPAPIIELKGRTIDSLSVRLSHGESFGELVSQTSEDEASRKTGGDIGFFSKMRMPSDFLSVVEKMPLNEVSPPFETGLGFHIVRVTGRQSARRMTFEEARPEIILKLENERRQKAVNRLVEKCLAEATFPGSGL